MLSPFLFQPRSNCMCLKVSWSDIAFEFNKEVQSIFCLKTDKQCKERWLNHLSPFLNKLHFLFFKNKLKIFFKGIAGIYRMILS